jgi:rod shape-determining protein MreB
MSQALGRLARDLAIDLGTANTLIYVQGRGVALDEPSVVAVQNGSATGYRQVVAVGEEAKRMLGRTPGSISAIRPLRSGVIADFKLAEEMLRHFIGLAIGRQGMLRPRILVSVPSGITDVERRAVFESARAAGGREIFLVSEPLAAALGAALPVMEPAGSMVVDIGGGTTEVAVISMGGLVRSASLRVAGDQMDEAIVQMLKNEHGIQIGERMAEELKITLGCAMPQEVKSTSIRGRDVRSGTTRAVTVTNEQLRLALAKPIGKILEAVQGTLADTPPELAADLVDRGVVLCGGGAMLPGLADWFSQSTGLDFQVTEEPLSCVVRGAGMALEDPILLNRVAMD